MRLYVNNNNKIFGPMSLEKVEEYFNQGILRRQDQVSESRNGPWVSIAQLRQDKSIDQNKEQKTTHGENKNRTLPPLSPNPKKPSKPAPVHGRTAPPNHKRPPLTPKQPASSQKPVIADKPANPPAIPKRPPTQQAKSPPDFRTPTKPKQEPKQEPKSKSAVPDEPPLISQPASNDVFQEKISEPLKNITDQGVDFFKSALKETRIAIDDTERITISDKLIIGRNAEHADWLVPDPSVSSKHAEISLRNGSLFLRDLVSRTGTVLNNKTIGRGRYQLEDGDKIQVGSATYIIEGCAIVVASKNRHAHVICTNLSKDVYVPGGKRKLRILNQVNLNIPPGSFVVLLGPSGSGKSTLLKAMSHCGFATEGKVTLNQEDLYRNFERLKTRMATVQQKDLLHDQLTLKSALNFTARLRLPIDSSTPEIKARVDEVLIEIGMTEKADSTIATYSGGQLKRASLANELLQDPSLLFIDEATSGLDENSDREIMAMLRGLADTGKTIICITHNLGNVMDRADTLVVLAEGGHLAFVGSPKDSLQYFDIDNLNQLYLRLKEKPGLVWASQLDATGKNAWAKQHQATQPSPHSSGKNEIRINRKQITFWQQLGMVMHHSLVVFLRILLLQSKDLRSLWVAAAQPLVVFFLICIVFGNISDLSLLEKFQTGQQILFMLGISTFWFGCNNSAKEIVKERELYQREKNAGLRPTAYLGSKFVFLLGMTIFQSLLLFALTKTFTGLEGSNALYYGSLISTAICGVCLGLAISVFSSNTDVAATAVPLAIIPQVILAGAIKPLEGLSELIAGLVAPSYWSFGSLCYVWRTHLDISADYAEMFSHKTYFFSLNALWLFSAVLLIAAASRLTDVKILKAANNTLTNNSSSG